MLQHFLEGIFALSADAALLLTFTFTAMGAGAAVIGLYILKKGGYAAALRLLGMSVAVFLAAWLAYGKYQELLVNANGVATGPIYENIAVIVVLCLPLTLMLSLLLTRQKNDQKS